MIIDLEAFIERERSFWDELESKVKSLERDPERRLSFDELQRFHYLYERAASALGKLRTYSLQPDTVDYLERLVSAAYAEVQDGNRLTRHFSLKRWFFVDWPASVLRHGKALVLSFLVMLIGCFFGAVVLWLDPGAKQDIFPFEHLMGDPSERVAREEGRLEQQGSNYSSVFSAQLMTHNTRVSILALSLGMTWGIGTIVMMFYNGVILGAVAFDYIVSGELIFLLGWLLPHGIVEIPAILIAGQGGFVLARGIIGWKSPYTLGVRLRGLMPDLVTLISGVALMLIWAGLIEAFLSQIHEPQIPYAAKILFGCVEGAALFFFFHHFGKRALADEAKEGEVRARAPHSRRLG